MSTVRVPLIAVGGQVKGSCSQLAYHTNTHSAICETVESGTASAVLADDSGRPAIIRHSASADERPSRLRLQYCNSATWLQACESLASLLAARRQSGCAARGHGPSAPFVLVLRGMHIGEAPHWKGSPNGVAPDRGLPHSHPGNIRGLMSHRFKRPSTA